MKYLLIEMHDSEIDRVKLEDGTLKLNITAVLTVVDEEFEPDREEDHRIPVSISISEAKFNHLPPMLPIADGVLKVDGQSKTYLPFDLIHSNNFQLSLDCDGNPAIITGKTIKIEADRSKVPESLRVLKSIW